jgi:hypothetical protein
MVLVQTKTDLKDEQPFTDEEVQGLNKKLGTKLFLTCAKEDINVKEVFEYLADEYLTGKDNAKKNKTENSGSAGPVSTIQQINNPTKPAKKIENKTVKLNASKSDAPKTKKKGKMGWCSIL